MHRLIAKAALCLAVVTVVVAASFLLTTLFTSHSRIGSPPAGQAVTVTPQPLASSPLSPAIPPPPLPASAAVPVACPPGVIHEPEARCLQLTVPADWQSPPSQPTIRLFAAIYPATGPNRQDDPLLVIMGGPGQAGSRYADRLAKKLAAIRTARDLIFIDQRGTGLSSPALDCRNIDPLRYWYGGVTADDALTCLRPIRAAGFLLESFDTEQSAHDLMAFRTALNIRQWNILATSYGGILAQILVRLDENGVRGIVFNSPGLPGATWLDQDRFDAVRSALRLAISDCAAQTACARVFPGLDGVIPRLSQKLTHNPLVVPVSAPGPDRGETARMLAWGDIANVLAAHAGSGNGAASIPRLLDYLARAGSGAGDPTVLRSLLMPSGLWKVFEELSYGLNLTVGCREERPHIDAAALRAAAAAYYPYAVADMVETDFDAACPALELAPAPATFYQQRHSTVPALILTGAYDTFIPTSRSDTLAIHFPAAQLVRFRGLGHDVLSASTCAAGLADNFLAAPAQPLKVQCAERALPPVFNVQPLGR